MDSPKSDSAGPEAPKRDVAFPSFAVRRADPGDASTLAALAITVWVDTYAAHGLPPVYADYLLSAYSKEGLAASLSDSARALWVAETSDGLLGFVELAFRCETPELAGRRQAEVVHLYVLERFARRGVGRTLLRRSAEEAAKKGVEHLWLAAYAENRRALAFYGGLGWRQVGETAFELGGVRYPNVVLSLSLAQAARPQLSRAGPS